MSGSLRRWSLSTGSFEACFRSMPRKRLSELSLWNYKIIKETEEEILYLSPAGVPFTVDKSASDPEVWFDDEVDMGQLAN